MPSPKPECLHAPTDFPGFKNLESLAPEEASSKAIHLLRSSDLALLMRYGTKAFFKTNFDRRRCPVRALNSTYHIGTPRLLGLTKKAFSIIIILTIKYQ